MHCREIFQDRHGKKYSEFKKTTAGVLQGSVLGPILYLLYISDILQDENAIIAKFADDIAILAIGESTDTAIGKLQCYE